VKRSIWLAIALSVLVSLVLVTCEAPYSDPLATFEDSDLAGTWEAHYGDGAVDRLIIRADGTFKQIYRDRTYAYETPWSKWWVERFPDGKVQVHLEGARYYSEFTEQDELFYDPFADELVKMDGELILNVRRLSSGELVLHHMWTHGDRGFAIIGGDSEMFRCIQTP
jgi:hypothetical protein